MPSCLRLAPASGGSGRSMLRPYNGFFRSGECRREMQVYRSMSGSVENLGLTGGGIERRMFGL